MITDDDEKSRISGGILIDWDLSDEIVDGTGKGAARRRMRTVS